MLIKMYTRVCDDITLVERDIRALEQAQDKALRDAENCGKVLEAKREYLAGLKREEKRLWHLLDADTISAGVGTPVYTDIYPEASK